MRTRLRALCLAVPLALAALASSHEASAFCGFYVSGVDSKQLFNNATMVVMMREGTRTVLSMQNNYQGPPESFAMVVPVPIVLQKENVKTLRKDVFDHVDKLAAPRLVEYWEQDPCYEPPQSNEEEKGAVAAMAAPSPQAAPAPGYGVKIEAQFSVGEYEIVILSAQDSGGLDAWLKDNGYKIPANAEPLLRPYVQSGMKFFVAKVDASKVRFEKGMASLSPLRFHYDAETFNLPIRLGLVNSSGTQDLIVHILSRGKRYEAANYKNVTIPTNIDIDEKARARFGEFYAALFDRTAETNPGAVVTEYSWGADSCDPCPSSPLDPGDFATLGGDVMPGVSEDQKWVPTNSFVLTRLHARYGKNALGEDLVFRVAKPIVGGREFNQENGKLETGAREMPEGSISNFQGRYAIRHPWTGPIRCSKPRRGVWGGPPEGVKAGGTEVARDLAFAPRGQLELASYVEHGVPEIGLSPKGANTVPGPGELSPVEVARKSGCAACAVGEAPSDDRAAWLAAFAAAVGFAGLHSRRKRR